MAHQKIIDSVKKQGQVTIKDLDEFLRFVINEYDMRTLNNNYISILIPMQLDVKKLPMAYFDFGYSAADIKQLCAAAKKHCTTKNEQLPSCANRVE